MIPQLTLVFVIITTEDRRRLTANIRPLTDDRRPRNTKTGPMKANRSRAGVSLSLLISDLTFGIHRRVRVFRARVSDPVICHLTFEILPSGYNLRHYPNRSTIFLLPSPYSLLPTAYFLFPTHHSHPLSLSLNLNLNLNLSLLAFGF